MNNKIIDEKTRIVLNLPDERQRRDRALRRAQHKKKMGEDYKAEDFDSASDYEGADPERVHIGSAGAAEKLEGDPFGLTKCLPADLEEVNGKMIEKYPFKQDFLRKFKFAKEFLDLNDCFMGVRAKRRPSPDHDFIIMDCFDVRKDVARRDQLFNKVLKQL